MEPLLVGLSAPSIASAAGAVGHAASAVAKPFAALLHEIANPDGAKEPTGTKLSNLQASANALQEDLEHRIYQAIDSAGVEMDSDLRLRLSALDETLEVVSDHSQRSVLEAALANDPSIANDFRELAAMKQLLSAANKHEEFSDEYSHNPERAAAEFAWKAGGSLEANLRLESDNQRFRIKFDSDN